MNKLFCGLLAFSLTMTAWAAEPTVTPTPKPGISGNSGDDVIRGDSGSDKAAKSTPTFPPQSKRVRLRVRPRDKAYGKAGASNSGATGNATGEAPSRSKAALSPTPKPGISGNGRPPANAISSKMPSPTPSPKKK